MNVFKYKQIVVSGYSLIQVTDEDYTLEYDVCYDEDVYHKIIEIPKFLDPQITFDLYRLFIATSAYSFALLAPKVYVNIPLSTYQMDFLSRIKASYYTNLRVFVGMLVQSPDCVGEVVFHFSESFKERVFHKKYRPNTAVILYSGGRDSMMCDIVLQRAGLEVYKLVTNRNIMQNPKSLDDFKDCDVVELSNAMQQDDDVVMYGTWDNPSWTMEYFVWGMIYAISNEIQYICGGEEYECTSISFDNFGGSMGYGRMWAQSNFALKEFQRYMYFLKYDGEVFSPIQNMTSFYEECIFSLVYPDWLDKQLTCASLIKVKDNKVQPCLSCVKCRTQNAFLVGLNKLLVASGLEKIKSRYLVDEDVTEIPSTPVHIHEHYLDDEQLRQIYTLLGGEFNESDFKLKFDMVHPKELLPNKVYRALLEIDCELQKKIEVFKKIKL